MVSKIRKYFEDSEYDAILEREEKEIYKVFKIIATHFLAKTQKRITPHVSNLLKVNGKRNVIYSYRILT